MFELCRIHLSVLFLMTALSYLSPAQAQTDGDQKICLQGFLETGADSLTLGEMRARCMREPVAEEPVEAALDKRLTAERTAASQPFSILAHKPNYILGAAYNQRGWDSSLVQQLDPDYLNDDVEIQFQFSFKVPLAIDLFDGRMDIFTAYTNRSFWQAYNGDNSAPFRETNHEPEVWVQFRNDWEIWGLTNRLNAFGLVHQSNGRAELLSRSWNRMYANFVFAREGFALSVKPWIWLDRNDKNSDNPDIDDYLGHGEVRAAWDHNGHVLSTMVRNQLESGFERGAVELGWSFPVLDYPYLKGYVQYFYGYGESLIDYDRRVNRLGIGISITDWLD